MIDDDKEGWERLTSTQQEDFMTEKRKDNERDFLKELELIDKKIEEAKKKQDRNSGGMIGLLGFIFVALGVGWLFGPAYGFFVMGGNFILIWLAMSFVNSKQANVDKESVKSSLDT